MIVFHLLHELEHMQQSVIVDIDLLTVFDCDIQDLLNAEQALKIGGDQDAAIPVALDDRLDQMRDAVVWRRMPVSFDPL